MIPGPGPPPVPQFLLQDSSADGKEIFNLRQRKAVEKAGCDLYKGISILSLGTPGLTANSPAACTRGRPAPVLQPRGPARLSDCSSGVSASFLQNQTPDR